jgi:hypothetical protein
MRGQAKYLQGATLKWMPWSAHNPEWEHDHCEFCWVHFGDRVLRDDPNTQLEGWTDQDSQHWVCQSCFEDFQTSFDWKIESATLSNASVEFDEYRERIRLAVEPLIGLKIWGWGQVMGMLQLGFGDLHSSEVRYGPKRGTVTDESEYILHAQCYWAVNAEDELVLEYGPDCFDRAGDEPFWNEVLDIPNGETSSESRLTLQSAIGLGGRTLESIEILERLGLLLTTSDDVNILIKGPRFDGEEWRLFRTGSRDSHFVVEQVDEGPNIGLLKVSWH